MTECMYDACMPHIQVRDVAPQTHAVLRRRASERGVSLQEYLTALLDAVAAKPTVEEVLRRAGEHTGGRVGLRQAADDLRADRDGR